MSFVFDEKTGNWTGSGVITNPNEYFIVDPKTGNLVSTLFPSGGADFEFGGSLRAPGNFPVLGLVSGTYTLDTLGGKLTASPGSNSQGITVSPSGTGASLTILDGAIVDAGLISVAHTGSGVLNIGNADVSATDLTIAFN